MKVVVSLACLVVFLSLTCQLCDADTTVDFVRLKAKKKARVRFTGTCSYSLSEIVTGNAVFEINLGTPISGFQSQDVRLVAEEGNVTRVEIKRRKLRPPVYNVTFFGSYVGDAETPPNGTCSSLQTPATQSNCLPGWKEFGFSCFLVQQRARNFESSQSACWLAKNGAHLAQLTTKSKNDFVKEIVQGSGVKDVVYIGGYKGFSPSYFWMDGTPFSETFTDWIIGPKEPFRLLLAAVMILPEMKWAHAYPLIFLSSICEYCYK